jgi:hypothetical protein
MKTFKTILVVLVAAVLPMALFASPSSAALGVDDQSTVSGSLNPWDDATGAATSPVPTSFETGQTARFQANFANASAKRTVKLYRVGSPDAVATATANSSGNAYLNYEVIAGEQQVFAEDSSGLETETDTYTGTEPLPQTGVLDAPSSSGTTWKAHFTPGVKDRVTKLQVQRIVTEETNEVNEATWKDVATAKQASNGDVTFSVSSSNLYRVAHKYRAIAGSTTSNEVEFKVPATSPKSTGLSAVYYNTNEGAAVDSRETEREGEFSMTASTKAPECKAVNSSMEDLEDLKLSTLKGRGNYSWSFKRKSYTLKLGKKADLCGLGSNTKWALVSQDYDKSFMRNRLAQEISSKLDNMAWNPQSRPVDFYLNGKYLGNYMLVERIGIDKDKVNIPELKADDGKKACDDTKPALGQRVNPTHPNNLDPCITGGYLLEWDFRKGADYNAQVGNGHWVGVKDPENDYNREGELTNAGASPQQNAYIRTYLNEVDDVLRSSNITSSDKWTDYIDEASAVDYYIAMEFMKPIDGNMWASVNMYKARNGKLYFGPIWDFDLAAGSANRAGNAISSSGFYLRNNLNISAMQPESAKTKPDTWFNRLNKNSDFRAAVRARWKEVEPQIHIGNIIDPLRNVLASSAATSFSSSPSSYSYRISDVQTIKGSWTKDVDNLKSWANNREKWLTSNF